MRIEKMLVCFLSVTLVAGAVVWAGGPPSQNTPEELLWTELSQAADADLMSRNTLRLMNRFFNAHEQHPKAANVHYMYSERHFRAGEFQKAAVGFGRFLQRYPRHELADSASFRLGEAYYNTGAYNSAATAWEEIVAKHRGSALAPDALHRLAKLQMRFREWGKADDFLIRLKRQYPHYAAMANVRESDGIVQYHLKNYPDSVQQLQGMEAGKGAFYRGLSLFSLHLYEDAVAALAGMAAATSGVYVETAAFLKAESFFQKQDTNLAAAEFRDFVSRFPRSTLVPYAELRRAACGLLLNDAAGAVQAADRAMRGTPPFEVRVYGTFIKGAALAAQGNHAGAAPLFQEVGDIKEYPNLAAAALVRKAWSHKQLKQTAPFDATLRQLEERYPASAEMAMARFLQGANHFENGQWEDAAARFEQGVLSYRYTPLSEAGLALMTIAYTEAGRLDQLVTSANAALRLFRKHFSSESVYWRAQSDFFIGKAYVDLNRPKDAIPFLETVTTRYANHTLAPRAQLMLAWAYADTGQHEKAREKAQPLVDAKGVPSFLSVNAQFLIASTHFNQKDYDKALIAFAAFLKDHPRSDLAPRVRYLSGLSHHQKRTYGSAIEEWNTLIADHPDHVLAQDAYLHIGDLYFRSEEYEKASNFFRTFRSKWPGSPYAERAMWQELQADFNGKDDEAAIRSYPVFIETFPDAENIRDAHGQLEMVYFRRGEHGDPEKLTEFLRRYPESPFAPQARFKLGDMALEQKQWGRAAQEMEQFLRDHPNDRLNVEALYGLGMAYENAGETEKAMVQYRNLMERFASRDQAVDGAFRLGSLHFKAERYHEAAQAFEFATKKKMSDSVRAHVHFNLALSYENLGQFEKAAENYARFARVSADKDQVREALLTAGLLLREAGQFRGAMRHFRELLKDAGSPDMELQAVNLLAESQMGAKQERQAIRTYERLIYMEPAASDLRVAGLAQLAFLHEQRNEMEKAIQVYEKIAISEGKQEWVSAAEQRITTLSANLNPAP